MIVLDWMWVLAALERANIDARVLRSLLHPAVKPINQQITREKNMKRRRGECVVKEFEMWNLPPFTIGIITCRKFRQRGNFCVSGTLLLACLTIMGYATTMNWVHCMLSIICSSAYISILFLEMHDLHMVEYVVWDLTAAPVDVIFVGIYFDFLIFKSCFTMHLCFLCFDFLFSSFSVDFLISWM